MPATTDQLLGALEQYWGYTSFRPLQQEAMEAILGSRDSLVVLPTGGGKSLCFQAPALLSDRIAVVVSPLISLMKDQVDTLVGNGVAAASYHSALAPGEKSAVAAGIREGRYRLIYVAPERLVGEGSESFLNMIGRRPVSFMAVDEAHCISQWGHDFRPEYRQLARLREQWPGVSLHAYTATATARVRRDIVQQLGLRDPVELVGSFDRPNLLYRVLVRATLKRQLQDVLARHPRQAGIIYCQSRKEVDALAAWLSGSGLRAAAYHAGLPDEERHRNQDAFINEDIDVIVATVAFGMGIDRSDVRFVVHAGAPQSLEHYQQESGRAGRDGLEAECVLIASAADYLKWRAMFEKNGELSDARVSLLRDIERYASSVGCRHKRLVAYFGQPYTKDDCGACDFCLGELEEMPGSVTIARMILSTVARVEIDGVKSRGHHNLSVFGLMREGTIDEVRGYIEQLIARGLLTQTDDAFPVVRLTADGVSLMKDEGAMPDLVLARQRKPVKDKLPKRSRVETESWAGVDRDLFEALRALRLRVARERHVPPYVIFHDTSLRELARLKPTSVEAMRHVYGVGARKADDLGEAVLDVIREFAGR
jgi:ATP-dependent DNA helicase RecQ